jgi:hypothetical protein
MGKNVESITFPEAMDDPIAAPQRAIAREEEDIRSKGQRRRKYLVDAIRFSGCFPMYKLAATQQ